MAYACVLHRSELPCFVSGTASAFQQQTSTLWLKRLLPLVLLSLLEGLFAGAWRNYLKSVYKRGFMYRLSSSPSAVFYIAENKTLAGKEDKTYEGEALGRKLAIVLFEDVGGGLARRVHRDSLGVQQQQFLTLAELLHTIGGATLLPDPRGQQPPLSSCWRSNSRTSRY